LCDFALTLMVGEASPAMTNAATANLIFIMGKLLKVRSRGSNSMSAERFPSDRFLPDRTGAVCRSETPTRRIVGRIGGEDGNDPLP
jgi:hypothetical protein